MNPNIGTGKTVPSTGYPTKIQPAMSFTGKVRRHKVISVVRHAFLVSPLVEAHLSGSGYLLNPAASQIQTLLEYQDENLMP